MIGVLASLGDIPVDSLECSPHRPQTVEILSTFLTVGSRVVVVLIVEQPLSKPLTLVGGVKVKHILLNLEPRHKERLEL